MAIALLYQRSSLQHRLEAEYAKKADTVDALQNSLRDQLGILSAGDQLKSTRILASSGDTLTMQGLARRYRYIYFYRPECAACDFVTPRLRSLNSGVAFVRFHRDSVYSPESFPNHFALVKPEAIGEASTIRVPSLVIVDSGGRVISAAHSDARRVLRLLSLAGLSAFDEDLRLLEDARRRALEPQQSPAGGGDK